MSDIASIYRELITLSREIGTWMKAERLTFDQADVEYKGFFGGIEIAHKSFPFTALMVEHNSHQPILGIRHLFMDRLQLMFGIWDLKKMTMNLSYHVNL